MRREIPILLVLLGLGVAGCDDTATAPSDITPPAAPRGLFSVTGDGKVNLHWLANTETDISGYRIYQSPCASGASCPYDRIGATSSTQFVVGQLVNGTTRYFAVAAVDRAGNESQLSAQSVFDTPRPQGTAALNNFVNSRLGAGWDFSAGLAKASTDSTIDIFFGDNGSVSQMFTPDVNTDIQDAGFASNLDAVDFSPVGADAGWSPTGSVEVIPGHCYIVWTRDDHYAKFQVTGVSAALVSFTWAYQTAAGNPELRARPARPEGRGPRPIAWLRK